MCQQLHIKQSDDINLGLKPSPLVTTTLTGSPPSTSYEMAAADQKKALAAKKAVTKGAHSHKAQKVRTTTTFRLPQTLKHRRQPKYLRKSVPRLPRMDEYKVIIKNINSEVATQKIEAQNTLVLEVHMSANKGQIKQAVKKVLGADALKVNTLVRPDGTKKAFVRLTADHDALDVASRAGYL